MAKARQPVRPYHHGRLREAVLEAAVAEIEAVGPARLSMREIARRAGVSHAAPAHHFGDKAGIFTAIATDGYRLLREATRRGASGDDALLQGGIEYVRFALTHRAHFEVMFRPELHRSNDPELIAARDAAFEVMFDAVERALADAAPAPADVLATAVAAWSQTHGLAVLWINGNLPSVLTDDPQAIGSLLANGMVTLGEITRTQAESALRALGTSADATATSAAQRRRRRRRSAS